ncbi:long-chain acyl-CoA synthetase [Panacagrimonas perspica]|uniref:Long-chain acyl-CoA synthetase n=1 Tax=Panacagrimonas perspica TaxID=381431 RepID=A0A4S3K2U8_9GAMM|nr:AMP-binding protein [Panacagrimonas perspica]TDU28836.1 long-chain acyl-CoA synthetase [Panacagrimonas perspica]THD02333.1 AMP-dependent synthetase [Panacagrimonas perspica]
MVQTQTTLINRVAIGDIPRRVAVLYPDKIAFIDGDRRVTHREFDQRCNQFARHLLGRGLKKGDAVACLCVNSLDFIVAAFGIAKAGLVWVPMNVLLKRQQLDYILEKVDAKLLIVDEALLPVMREAGRTPPDLLTIDDPSPVARTKSGGPNSSAEASPDFVRATGGNFAYAFSGQPTTDPEVEIQDRDTAIVMFTSGTTAEQKGVVISHLAVYLATLNNIIEMEMRTDDVTVAMLPFFHCAQHTLVSSFLHRGATQIVMRGFDAETLMRHITDQRVTWCFALPTMWRAVLDHPQRAKYRFDSMRYGLYAMTPMDAETLSRLIHEICPRFALSSGQTEVYPSACVFRPEYQFTKKGQYWGQQGLTCEFQIMDDAGNLLPRGQIGELVVRGPTVLMEYLKDEAATAASREHGWHHTGDLGLIDEDGQFLFSDRKKDMIKSGGENVASCTVEGALLGHPGVAAAAVVGLPHDYWIEAVTAFVVPKPGIALSEDEIGAWCRERLGKHEVPKRVVFLERFPMTVTGKILKHVIRSEHAGLFREPG